MRERDWRTKLRSRGAGGSRHGAPRERQTDVVLYGWHSVTAALANPARHIRRLLATENALRRLNDEGIALPKALEIVRPGAIAARLTPDAVHQGLYAETDPLPSPDIETLPAAGLVLVLDQITDPHNVGAILRSAAAFGATAVVVQDRHAPSESGVLAKAASGALDSVPYVEVVNIARALEQLGEHEFWRIALAGDGEAALGDASREGDIALVLGSEGSGIRRLVRERCDVSAFIPIDSSTESLNVSNAGAVALYELRRAH